VESIRPFDPTTQRSTGTVGSLAFKPVSEVRLDDASMSRFRSEYRALFGAVGRNDPLYEAVSAGRRHMGMEHWLALFYEKMETLFDYLPEAVVVLDPDAEDAREARLDLIAEYFTARANIAGRGAAAEGLLYNPVPPERLYLDGAGWEAVLAGRSVGVLSPFEAPAEKADAVNVGAKPGHDFADARVRPDVSLFEVVKDFVAAEQRAGRRVVISAFSTGARERLMGRMKDRGLEAVQAVSSWRECSALPPGTAAVTVARLERGFTGPALSVITEPDILGERLVRRARSMVDPENIITEASALQEGDLVVHVDHGIGRFEGLEGI
jgi:transcription-repair coupling factor (superfamily II helicase)